MNRLRIEPYSKQWPNFQFENSVFDFDCGRWKAGRRRRNAESEEKSLGTKTNFIVRIERSETDRNSVQKLRNGGERGKQNKLRKQSYCWIFVAFLFISFHFIYLFLRTQPRSVSSNGMTPWLIGCQRYTSLSILPESITITHNQEKTLSNPGERECAWIELNECTSFVPRLAIESDVFLTSLTSTRKMMTMSFSRAENQIKRISRKQRQQGHKMPRFPARKVRLAWPDLLWFISSSPLSANCEKCNNEMNIRE